MIPHIKKIIIRNYKSIAGCDVDLSPFTLLVGRNGAGKSNFVDAINFVRECLSERIELAFQRRGGIGAVRLRSGGRPTHIGIRLLIDLGQDLSADYGFKIAAKPTGKFTVAMERCVLYRLMMETPYGFEVQKGRFTKGIPGISPKVEPDRLALYAASAREELRPLYDFLTSMRFYSIVPDRIRELQEPDPGESLKRDGSNAPSVLKRLASDREAQSRYERLCRLLARAVEGVEGVESKPVGRQETLEFRQEVGAAHPWRFEALSMSDGTLRVLGVLLAVYQLGKHSVIAIEEPEATVHPAIAELVVQVLMDAAKERQVIVTTHSPDILDHRALSEDQIRVVTAKANRTLISRVSPAGRAAILDRLYTPGELLRVNELNPDLSETKLTASQADLFDPIPRSEDEQ